MNKNFEKDYIIDVEQSAPDTERLWNRICTEQSADDDLTPFEDAAKQCRFKVQRNTGFRAIAAIAAVFAVIISLNSFGISNETDYAVNDAASDMFMEAAKESAENESVGYSTYCSYSREYSTLNLAETESGIYAALSNNTDEAEYFVEADVLKRTELFLDARIISSEIIDGEYVEYTVEPIRIISDNTDTADYSTVYSNSCYLLRNNREYLLPISISDGMPVVVFDDAPQIEITGDREVVFHNGWKSLMTESRAIMYEQVYEDDYFYDRMNINAEISLQSLFDCWEKYRS